MIKPYIYTCGFGEQVHGAQAVPDTVPSLLVKSKTLSRRITLVVESLSHVVSSARDEGTVGVALPPPVVPAAWPNAVPTACARWTSARATVT